MKIGIHVNSLPTTVFINRLIEALVKSGHEVVVFGTALKSFKKIEGAQYVYYTLYSAFNLSKILFFIKYAMRLAIYKTKQKSKLDAILASENKLSIHNKTQYYPLLWHAPNVLHIQWVKGVEQFLWVQNFNMKLAVSLRGSHVYVTPNVEPEVAQMFKRTFKKIDGFHAVCDDLIRDAEKYNLPISKAKTIYSGLDLDEYEFIKPSKKVPNEGNVLQIISLGRASWVKGYSVALDAMKLLKDAEINFKYSIVGSYGNEELNFQIHDLGLEKNVFLLPWQKFNEVKKRIQSADITLVSSYSEGIANVAIESMALGTLVVSTDCGGMRELTSNNKNGFLVPIRNPKSITEAILKVQKMPVEARDEMAKKAYEKVASEFNMYDKIKEFEEFYMTIYE